MTEKPKETLMKVLWGEWYIDQETKNENKKVTEKYEKNGKLCTTIKKLHSVFTSQMCSKSYGIINRDYNALLNMKEIVKSLLETKKRPIEFTRIKKQLPLVGKGC